jgi:hypothetical protein
VKRCDRVGTWIYRLPLHLSSFCIKVGSEWSYDVDTAPVEGGEAHMCCIPSNIYNIEFVHLDCSYMYGLHWGHDASTLDDVTRIHF